MNNILDTIKKQEKEFDEKLKKTLSIYNGEVLNKFQDEYLMEKGPGCEKILFPVLENAIKDFITPTEDNRYIKVNDASIIKDWHKSSSKALLEAVIERVDDCVLRCKEGWEEKTDLDKNIAFIKIETLSDLQSKLKEEIENIS